MPRIQIHKRGDKVESKGGRQSNEDDSRTRRGEESLEEFVGSIFGIDLCLVVARPESLNNQVQGEYYQVQLN